MDYSFAEARMQIILIVPDTLKAGIANLANKLGMTPALVTHALINPPNHESWVDVAYRDLSNEVQDALPAGWSRLGWELYDSTMAMLLNEFEFEEKYPECAIAVSQARWDHEHPGVLFGDAAA